MEIMRQLLKMEEDFWTAGAEFYRQNLAPGAVMVFPGLGLLEREAIIDGLAAAPRWESIEIREPRVVPLGQDAAVLTYQARARRAGESTTYSALISSAYLLRDGAWLLAVHHQSPLE
jgi:hypothetical protein